MEPIRSLEEPLEEPTRNPYAGRILFFKLGCFLLFAALASRLFWLQIVEGDLYRVKADDNRFRELGITAPRGVIYDRNGLLLVRNRPSYTVSVVPADLPANFKPVIQRLGHLIDMPPEAIERKLAPAPKGERTTDDFSPVSIKSDISATMALTIEERNLELPGVHVEVKSRREYPDGPITSHLLGYVSRVTKEQFDRLKDDLVRKYTSNDDVGQTGLEVTQEQWLRGIPGQRQLVVNASGQEVAQLAQIDAEPGRNLRLTIDLTLQREVINILNKHIKDYKSATAIVMDPRNGQILSLVTLPTYDNNLFSQGISQDQFDILIKDEARPLVNHAIADVYPPGSVFKLIVAAGALQEGIVTRYTQVNCPGYIIVPHWLDPDIGTKIVCWAVHGTQDLVSGLANSCDVYFYYLGGGPPKGEWEGLGVDRINKWARAFGLGQPTGIELPAEGSGNVPDDAWKRKTFKEPWYKGDTYNLSIGQGFVTVTPLQMTNVIAAIANGGTLYRPQLVMEVTDASGTTIRPFRPEVIRKLPVDAQHLADIAQGMRASMQVNARTPEGTSYVGTSHTADIPEVPIAGKTGTAEYGEPDQNGKLKTHGWFGAFAPYENPEVVVLVFVQSGGASDASERVEDILRYYFRLPPQPEDNRPRPNTEVH